jgi:hypothetical protein
MGGSYVNGNASRWIWICSPVVVAGVRRCLRLHCSTLCATTPLALVANAASVPANAPGDVSAHAPLGGGSHPPAEKWGGTSCQRHPVNRVRLPTT